MLAAFFTTDYLIDIVCGDAKENQSDQNSKITKRNQKNDLISWRIHKMHTILLRTLREALDT